MRLSLIMEAIFYTDSWENTNVLEDESVRLSRIFPSNLGSLSVTTKEQSEESVITKLSEELKHFRL